jgi:hypothetical protein
MRVSLGLLLLTFCSSDNIKSFRKLLCAVVVLLPGSQEAAERTAAVTTEPQPVVHAREMLPGAWHLNAIEGVKVLPLAADDQANEIVKAEFARIAAVFDKSDPRDTIVKFYEPSEIVSAAAKTVFPGYRFFLVAWEEYDADPKRHKLGRAADPHYFLAAAPDGTKTKLHEVPDGQLLVEARIRIRSQEEADLVWKALRGRTGERNIRDGSAIPASALGIYERQIPRDLEAITAGNHTYAKIALQSCATSRSTSVPVLMATR